MDIIINGTTFNTKNIEEVDNNLTLYFEPTKTLLGKLETELSDLQSIEGYDGYDEVISMERRYNANDLVVSIVKNVNAEEALKELTGGRLVTVKEAREMKKDIDTLENAIQLNTKLSLDSIAPTLQKEKSFDKLIEELE